MVQEHFGRISGSCSFHTISSPALAAADLIPDFGRLWKWKSVREQTLSRCPGYGWAKRRKRNFLQTFDLCQSFSKLIFTKINSIMADWRDEFPLLSVRAKTVPEIFRTLSGFVLDLVRIRSAFWKESWIVPERSWRSTNDRWGKPLQLIEWW